MSRKFYLYRRNGIFYAQFVEKSTKKLLSGKSTGQKDWDEAHSVAMEWYKNGIPNKRTQWKRNSQKVLSAHKLFTALRESELNEADVVTLNNILIQKGYIKDSRKVKKSEKDSVTFVDYLKSFWDFDNSEYVKEQLSTGRTIGRRRCKEALSSIDRYYAPFWKNTFLSDVNKLNLKQFCFWIAEQNKRDRHENITEEKLSPLSVNRITGYCTPALNFAFKNDIIKTDPSAGRVKMHGKSKRRGILTDKETAKLFSEGDWGGNEGSRLACLLSAQTGMRASELAALQVRDIGEDRVYVRHSWDRLTKQLKTPKNGEEREIPLLPETRKLILDYSKTQSWEYGPNSFIFHSDHSREIPQGIENFLSRLRKALESIGIGPEQQKARNLNVHSFRHYYAASLSRVLDEKTARYTGHRSQEMLSLYANHANEEAFKEALAATAEVFGKVIPFNQEAAK